MRGGTKEKLLDVNCALAPGIKDRHIAASKVLKGVTRFPIQELCNDFIIASIFQGSITVLRSMTRARPLSPTVYAVMRYIRLLLAASSTPAFGAV